MRKAQWGVERHDGWTTPVSSALGMAGFLAVQLAKAGVPVDAFWPLIDATIAAAQSALSYR